MQQLLTWTLQAIREENSDFSWMEEYRFEWTPLVGNAISRIIEGQSVLILTDSQCRWFGHYIQHKINDVNKNRPFLPFYQLSKLFVPMDEIHSVQELQLVEDMLDISYPNGYIIWYIGRGDHPCTKIAFKKDDSFLWIIDDQVQNSFPFRGSDAQLDIKFLQLFKLFDITLSAALFGNIEIGS
ncbi:MAG: HobA family DNA replication regulator [Sulfurovaceae bacterium]|nr:HobA family DNA replication regulator [Sulfurovaceae bacterium]